MILGYEELSQRWGKPVATLRVWKHRGKLPEYDAEPVGRVKAWKVETIETMEDKNGLATDPA